MTNINVNCPIFEEFAAECYKGGGSPHKALSAMGARGKLGLLAEEMQQIADAVVKAGYVPSELKEKHDYHDRLAKSVQDKEVAAFHREKAKQLASQMGEDVR
jgi:hypothetical protein